MESKPKKHRRKRKKVAPFIQKLWDALEDRPHLVSWNSDGRSFMIHDEPGLLKDVFGDILQGSFHRNLNLYNFEKDGDVVYHKESYFIRDQTDDCELLQKIGMRRQQQKLQQQQPGLSTGLDSLVLAAEWQVQNTLTQASQLAQHGQQQEQQPRSQLPNPLPVCNNPHPFQPEPQKANTGNHGTLQELKIYPAGGPLKGGTPVMLNNLHGLDCEYLIVVFGAREKKAIRGLEGNSWFLETPEWEKAETVPVIIMTPGRVEVGRTDFTYVEDEIDATIMSTIFNQSRKSSFCELMDRWYNESLASGGVKEVKRRKLMEDDASETLYSRADTGSPDLDKEVPGSDEFEKVSREDQTATSFHHCSERDDQQLCKGDTSIPIDIANDETSSLCSENERREHEERREEKEQPNCEVLSENRICDDKCEASPVLSCDTKLSLHDGQDPGVTSIHHVSEKDKQQLREVDILRSVNTGGDETPSNYSEKETDDSEDRPQTESAQGTVATAAPSPLTSSVEKTNGAKLSRLLIDGGTTVLRKVFEGFHPPANLASDLHSRHSILNNLLHGRILNRHQWDKLFPPGEAAPDSQSFDITLLFLLLTNICELSPPPSGWNTKPPTSDTSLEANLARIKFFRNILYAHLSTTGVDPATFLSLWQEISFLLTALGFDQAEIDRMRAENGGEEDYLDALFEWADSEEDTISQLTNVQQTRTKTQQDLEQARQIKIRGRGILQDCTSKVDEVQQYQTVEQLHQVFQHVKESKEEDETDKVLWNLAKIEFKADLEYYAQRFQEGTREWVFSRVQSWLEDRSSPNRVMLISGNAGTGKSVIAAVICQRMQAAGKLSGTHFFKHNNARYRNPQLTLQSLACQFCHALPEYKQTLVEQLSRNLGTDLNSMGVEELFTLLFEKPLSALSDPGRDMLMVIDGLDESEYQGRNELLNVVANRVSKLPSWIRFLVTTRPAMNIAENLKHRKPFRLELEDEKNVEDIRMVVQTRLQPVIKAENIESVAQQLVLRCEGLMLYAHFLIVAIEENPSVLDGEDLDNSFRLGISSVYYSYMKRLEHELLKEINVKEENFLNLLCAITASREPLPIDFASKLLLPGENSPIAKRRMLKALGILSSLFPIRNGCLRVIHKSVKHWLTDSSYRGEHDFIVEEKQGQRILASLCAAELDDLKRKGVYNVQFNATEKYALYHGVQHMFYSHEGMTQDRLEELTNAYVTNSDLDYAKQCVSSTKAAEDIVWLQKQGIYPAGMSIDHLSEKDEEQLREGEILGTLNTGGDDTPSTNSEKEKDDSEDRSRAKFGEVPFEIKARRRRVQRAYENALRTGKVKVYRARIMLIGQDRAGKTSLKRTLLGLPFNPNEQSTDGIEVDPSLFEIDVDQVKNWQRTDEVGVSQFANDLAKTVAEQIEEDEANLMPEILDEPKKVPTREELTKPENVQEPQSSGDSTSPTENAARNSVIPELKIDPALPPEEFTQHVIHYLENMNLSRDATSTSVENQMILDLWDFAGQCLYYASHPVFMSPRAIYMLVYNLSKELKNTAEPCFKLGHCDVRLKHPSGETNLENLLSWLVSVHTMSSANSTVDEARLPYLRPPVFIVGTHADMPCRAIREIELEIQQELLGKELDLHVIRPFFSIDNTQGSSSDGIRALQKRLIDILKQEPYMGQELPIRWFNFEKVIQALVAKEIYCCNLEQLKDAIHKVCFIDNDEEVVTMLDFYHDLGIIVKHGSTVVLQATWLADVFKQLITICPYEHMDPKHSKLWKDMEATGVLDMELVDHVFSKFCQRGLIREDILQMMEQFGLIVKFESPRNGSQYLVPAQLKTPPERLREVEPSSSDPCALYVHFERGFVPHGLYSRLVSRCARWCSESGFKNPPNLFQGASRFFIEGEFLCHLILFCRKRFIKIILKQAKPSNIEAPLAEDQVRETAKLVRVFVEDTLQSMSRDFPWLNNLKFQLCFECPYCPREENTCLHHGVVHCTQDDCICLQKLPSGGQMIYCQKSFCDKIQIPPGLSRWLPVKVKEGIPSADELEDLSLRIGDTWCRLGRRLNFDSTELKGFDHENQMLYEKAYEVLMRWKQKEGSAATYLVLYKALCHPFVNRRDLAEVCYTTLFEP